MNRSTSSDRSEKKVCGFIAGEAHEMMSDLILLQLLLPARDADERGLWCVLSTSTASHRAAVYDGQTEPPLRRRALPDGRLLRFRRDPNASHHLSGKPTREQRHVQVREGPDRPEVGRSSGGRTSERCCAMSCGTVRLIALFPGSLSPPEQTLCLIPQKKPHLSPSSVLALAAASRAEARRASSRGSAVTLSARAEFVR